LEAPQEKEVSIKKMHITSLVEQYKSYNRTWHVHYTL